MTTTFRERIEAMTPGALYTQSIDDEGVPIIANRPGVPMGETPTNGMMAHVSVVAGASGGDPAQTEANATGIVLSVATARLVASDELPRNMARVMLNLQEGPATAERMEREETIQWRNRLRDAKAVLSAIQAAAMEEV